MFLNHEAPSVSRISNNPTRDAYLSAHGGSRGKGSAVGDDDKKDNVTPITEAKAGTAAAVKKKRGRPRTNKPGQKAQVMAHLEAFLMNHGHPDQLYCTKYDVVASSGVFKSWPIRNVRAKSISKSKLVGAIMLAGIPEHLPTNEKVWMAALEDYARTQYVCAWQELNDRINTYIPWPKGYDPFEKLILAIGSEKAVKDSALYLDLHCGLRHFIMQQKRVVAGISTKDEDPITLIAHGVPNSGKSHLFSKTLFGSVYGEWFTEDTFDLLLDQFKQKRASEFPIILLDEMEKATDVKREFKRFVSAKTLTGRGIYTDEVGGDDNISSLICITNDKPPFGLYDESEGIARRVLPFPCNERRFRERPNDVLNFTPEDGLAMFTGLDIEDDRNIWDERATSLRKRQAVMRTEGFVEQWLTHRTIRHPIGWDDATTEMRRARRWHFSEVIEDMSAFKRTIDRKAVLNIGLRPLRTELEAAGALVKQAKSDFYLVSHMRRTPADTGMENELDD